MRDTYDTCTHKARLCHICKTYVDAGQSVNIEIRKKSSDLRTFLELFYRMAIILSFRITQTVRKHALYRMSVKIILERLTLNITHEKFSTKVQHMLFQTIGNRSF